MGDADDGKLVIQSEIPESTGAETVGNALLLRIRSSAILAETDNTDIPNS